MNNIAIENRDNEYLKGLVLDEGGYVNHEDDPGGETKYGVSKTYYPDLDIKNLTPEKAKQIHKIELGQTLYHFGANRNIAYKLSDIRTNAGPGISTEILQRAVNDLLHSGDAPMAMFLKEDGKLSKDGGSTKERYMQVLQTYGEIPLMNAIIKHQKQYYRGEDFHTKTIHPSLVEEFGEGWLNRAQYNPIIGEHTRHNWSD